MKAFFKLIRWPNLLIIILTMVLIRYAVIAPVLSKISITLYLIAGNSNTASLQLPWYDFMTLVIATVCIAAAGYVINDYFDIKTDLINRGKVIVGTKIPRRQAIMWHNALNMVGVAAGIYVSWKIGYFLIGILFLLVSGLLYFYSASYKRQFLVGNIVVAILTAMVPLLVVIFEAPALYQYYAVNAVKTPDLSIIYYWVGGFSIFAFLATLTREIIKDIEDFEGDAAYGRNTIPVIIGVLTSKIVAISLMIITMAMLYLSWIFFLKDSITFIYFTVAIAAPLFIVIFKLLTVQDHKQLHSASNVMNIVMLTGILYSIVVKIIKTFNLI
jgi:4-hydroxybenzoate polyprenyltransferase